MLLYIVVSQLVAFMEEHLGLLSIYNHELNSNQNHTVQGSLLLCVD